VRRRIQALLLALALGSFVQGTWIYAKALLAQLLLHRAWTAAQAGTPKARPWPWADTWPVARLISPAHAVDLIVLEGATGSSTAFGPGRIQGTARPGEPGNLGLAGHRDTHFAFLRQLELGESLWLELPNGETQRFRVSRADVVDFHDPSALAARVDGLTLVTCYPFDAPVPGGPLRYVVQAQRAPG
jgi:sortase A